MYYLGPTGGTVIEDVSPNDVMYKSAPDYYFSLGRQALDAIQHLMAVVGLAKPTTILDLPSGHGRVLRFIRAAFPDASIDACDIDPDAVAFCARTFSSRQIYSTVDLTAIPIEGQYDLIWCGSLLTHLDVTGWKTLLRLFSDHLSSAGLLIFTTHGRHHANRFRSKQTTLGLSDAAATALLSDFDRIGFGFQNHASRDGYGISMSSPPWVCSQIIRTGGLRLAGYQERGWGGNQDVVACVSDV